MYKRINKRIRKKEKEEALGLDDETKEMLGFPETDSDESDSSDEEQSNAGSSGGESDGDSEAESSGGSESPKLKRKRGGGSEDSGSSNGDDTEASEGEDEDLQEEDTEDDNAPPMTLSQALSDPLYSVRQGSDARECLVCPGKELKHAKMVSVHVTSSTHLRRMKRFAALAARVDDENEDPRLLVAALDESVRITPKEKASPKASIEPKVSRKERRLAKRQRRQQRKADKTADSKSSAPPASQAQERETTQAHASSKSAPDHVLQKKVLNRQLEGIKKHKMAKSNLQKTKFHKSLPSKNGAA